MNAFFKTSLLMAAMTGLFTTAGFLLAGQTGAFMALLIACAMNFFAYWQSDSLVLKQQKATLIDAHSHPNLIRMLKNLAVKADLPTPKLYWIDSEQPNAFATGRSPDHSAIAVTKGLVARLTADELEGVIAHELAHIKNRDTLTMTITASLAGALSFLAHFAFFFRGVSPENRPSAGLNILLMIFAPLAASLVQLAISRTREYEADARGAQISGKPEALASALQKISQKAPSNPLAEAHPASAPLFIINPLRGRGLAGLFATHPPAEERIRRLMAYASTSFGPASAFVQHDKKTTNRKKYKSGIPHYDASSKMASNPPLHRETEQNITKKPAGPKGQARSARTRSGIPDHP